MLMPRVEKRSLICASIPGTLRYVQHARFAGQFRQRHFRGN